MIHSITLLMKHRLHFFTAFLAILMCASNVGFAGAEVVSVMIGDDDGFGGTHGTNSDPGDAFTPFTSPSIAPGTYVDTNGMDVATAVPWTPYTFQFNFVFDSSSLPSVDSATVSIQTGSVARRTSGGGFGFADVTATIGADSLDLGDFWISSTGATGSVAEESVKLHTFDVTSLFSSTSSGTLEFTVDGSTLVNPIDQFSIDFAQLDLQSTAVPEPSSIVVLALGATCFIRRRRP